MTIYGIIEVVFIDLACFLCYNCKWIIELEG